ncbi:hypothetical protein PHMEG_00026195 [Phytophthora megakarya]|uniref:Uncharacterized protein n=1 Tax=Phytophthora megakarya TaxID=4795 RepID=A0A225VAA8_9STRA|nr:hypothetical protein PHMEG_00026195 [Phytophthora megakarya]
MSIATINTLRPSSQPRDQLVLQVENVALAGRRLLTIEIFEVPDAGPIRATTPLSPHRSPPSTPTNSDRNSGFRVAARDEVENEYSLFVGRQRAEYLYRSEYGTASETMTSEDMANGILAHLSIIGNRHRDVGVLVCKEPEAHFKKKIRILPVNTPPEKQKNPHLPSKRQDQRAVRIQKTSKRTMEAVAKAMKQTDRHLSGDNESIGNDIHSGVKFDRKSSEASILHRMAVGDSKPMWKAELETNYEESDRSSSFIEEDEDSIHKDKSYMLAPGLSPRFQNVKQNIRIWKSVDKKGDSNAFSSHNLPKKP